jgi:uncharacterized delta-60 repeat protein
VARFNTDGTLDSTFGSGGFAYYSSSGEIDTAVDLALQPDHKIVVVGGANGATDQLLVMRYNSDGSLDTTFDGTGVLKTGVLGPAGPGGVVIQQDGSIVVAGGISGSAALARFTSTGAVDTTFGTTGTFLINGLSYLSALAIHPNTGGEFDVAGGLSVKLTNGSQYIPNKGAVARVLPNGGLDTSFGGNAGLSSYLSAPTDQVLQFNAMALQRDGNIVVVGNSPTASSNYNILVARYYGASPQIGSFTANSNPVTAGSNETLTVSNISDANPGASITQVAIYLDSNNDGILEPGTDTLLGYATQSSPGVWSFTFTVSQTPGTYTLFAQAEDSYGLFSDPVAIPQFSVTPVSV